MLGTPDVSVIAQRAVKYSSWGRGLATWPRPSPLPGSATPVLWGLDSPPVKRKDLIQSSPRSLLALMVPRFHDFQLHSGFEARTSSLSSQMQRHLFCPLNRKGPQAAVCIHPFRYLPGTCYTLSARLLGATDTGPPAETTLHFPGLSWLLPPPSRHTCSADGAALTDERVRFKQARYPAWWE